MAAHDGDSKSMTAPHTSSQGGSSSAEVQTEPGRPLGAKEHELVRALVSTLPADYCTVIAPEEQLTHAEMLHELRESGRGEDSASARWSLADRHVQARFHVVHRNRVGSLGAITSLLSARGFNILNASVYSTSDGFAVNAFWLEPPAEAVHPEHPTGLVPVDDLVDDIDRAFAAMSLHSTPSSTPPPPGAPGYGGPSASSGSFTSGHAVAGGRVQSAGGLQGPQEIGRRSSSDSPLRPPGPSPDAAGAVSEGEPAHLQQGGGAPLSRVHAIRDEEAAAVDASTSSTDLEHMQGGGPSNHSSGSGSAAYGTPDGTMSGAMTGWPEEWRQPQFDSLRLIRQVAEGSMSAVWEGDWGGALVAVKILKAEPRASPGAREAAAALLREVKIWSNLRHPAVCSFMGTCVQRGLPAIVLEYLPGSLHDLLHKPTSGKHKLRPLGERVQVQIGREIATGVAYLHSEQLIHRDIKAANVLLDEHLHVKLADFGISTGFGPEHTAETGTYRYMAPEVIRHQQYDHKCDVYSYGVLLWEVLHRQVPFRTHSPLQAAYAVAMERERPPVALKSILAPFASVILACWDESPARRPDAAEVVEMLTTLEAAMPAPDRTSSSGSFLHSLIKKSDGGQA